MTTVVTVVVVFTVFVSSTSGFSGTRSSSLGDLSGIEVSEMSAGFLSSCFGSSGWISLGCSSGCMGWGWSSSLIVSIISSSSSRSGDLSGVFVSGVSAGSGFFSLFSSSFSSGFSSRLGTGDSEPLSSGASGSLVSSVTRTVVTVVFVSIFGSSFTSVFWPSSSISELVTTSSVWSGALLGIELSLWGNENKQENKH